MAGDLPVPDEKWLADTLRRMQAEIDELKGARQMMATLLRGGAFTFANEALTPMLRFGKLRDPTTAADYYAIVANDDNNSVVLWFSDNQRGMIYPFQQAQWIVPTAQVVTSGTFVEVAECGLTFLNNDVIAGEGVVSCPAGTVAEVRINDPVNAFATDPVTVDGHQAFVQFEWLHPYSIGWGDLSHPRAYPFLRWEVRRVSGAGNVTAFPPRQLCIKSNLACTHESSTGGGRAF